MTDWKPKFKVGDVVVTDMGFCYAAPQAYVDGATSFTVTDISTDSEWNTTREIFESLKPLTEYLAPSTPTPTKPDYYRFEARGVPVDIIDVIQGLGLGCEAGNVYKYLARAGKKDASKHIEDLEKAREWLDRLIEYRRRS
jgi:hypothetical protein